MKTNRHNLPEWLVEVIEAVQGQYERGEDTDFSVTQLIRPPQIQFLEDKYPDQVETDVAEDLDSVLGTAWHDACEWALKQNKDYIVERRYYAVVRVDGRDYILSAQIDQYNQIKRVLGDYKLTSVFKIKQGTNWDWELQLNFQRWLMENPNSWYLENGKRVQNDPVDISELYIYGFARDWRRGESERYPDYPDVKFKEVSIPIWEDFDVIETIKERIREKVEAEKGNVRPCTPEERWASPSKWALMKKGRKSAVKLFDSEAEAVVPDSNHYIEYRPGRNRRCEMYCPVGGDNPVCPQYRAILEGEWND